MGSIPADEKVAPLPVFRHGTSVAITHAAGHQPFKKYEAIDPPLSIEALHVAGKTPRPAGVYPVYGFSPEQVTEQIAGQPLIPFRAVVGGDQKFRRYRFKVFSADDSGSSRGG